MKNKIEKEIYLDLNDIKIYSKDVLNYLKASDASNFDKEELIAYFETVPSTCEELELLIRDLELEIEKENKYYE